MQGVEATNKMDMTGNGARQQKLVDMLQESHALLISDSHRLRADLEVRVCLYMQGGVQQCGRGGPSLAFLVLSLSCPTFGPANCGPFIGFTLCPSWLEVPVSMYMRVSVREYVGTGLGQLCYLALLVFSLFRPPTPACCAPLFFAPLFAPCSLTDG